MEEDRDEILEGIPEGVDPDDAPFEGSPSHRMIAWSRKYRGCPFGEHEIGEPHHYSCFAWMF